MPRLDEESGGKIKPVGFIHEYTKDQAAELIRCSDDPKYFIKKYVMIQHTTRGAIKFDMYDYQERLVDVYNASDRAIGMLPRQGGKCCAAKSMISVNTNVVEISSLIELTFVGKLIHWLNKIKLGLAIYAAKK